MTTTLPVYISHKRVQAAEIVSVGYYSVVGEDDQLMRSITLKDHAEPVQVAAEAFHRYVPLPGDFLVVYEDGYVSFSPRKAFVEGYTLAQPENVLMERLNDLAATERGQMVIPEWLRGFDAQDRVQRVAREAYVTINSLKLQLENLKREKAGPDQA